MILLMMMINALNPVSVGQPADSPAPIPLEFGFYLEGSFDCEYYDIFQRCLSHDITSIQLCIGQTDVLYPGVFNWALLDSIVSDAHEASAEDPSGDISLCLSARPDQAPTWCIWMVSKNPPGFSRFCDYENLDLFSDFYSLLAERYSPEGLLPTYLGWTDDWGVERFNPLGESDLWWCANDLMGNHLPPDQKEQGALADYYKQIRHSVRQYNPEADVALSFMAQPFWETLRYPCQPWVTGLYVGEFPVYMNTVLSEFTPETACDPYNCAPQTIDWHGYSGYNDPMNPGPHSGVWVIPDPDYEYFEYASFAQRSVEYATMLEQHGHCSQLAVLEAGSSPWWMQISSAFWSMDHHISFQLSSLADMAVSGRVAYLHFDTDIDDVTGPVHPGYNFEDWWNDSEEDVDLFFDAYARMAHLLRGSYCTSRTRILPGLINNAAWVHTFHDPGSGLNTHMVRAEFPSPVISAIRIPVSTRFVRVYGMYGGSGTLVDCGLPPYRVRLENVTADWIQWIEETTRQSPGGSCPDADISVLSGNPVRDTATFRLIFSSGSPPDEVSIVDLSGRIVTTIDVGEMESPVSISWDCRCADGSVAPNGVYFAHVKRCPEGGVSFVLLR